MAMTSTSRKGAAKRLRSRRSTAADSVPGGGSPRTEMVGNQIEFYLRGTSQPQTGASLVLILSAMLLVLMAYYLVTTVRAQKSVAT